MDEQQQNQVVQPNNVQVQPTTNISRARSRIGFAFYISIIALWVLVIMAGSLVNSIAGSALGYAKGDIGTVLILFIALAVPLVPLFIFSNNQLQKMIADPANVEDISFKKSVRTSLFSALFFGILNVVIGIYVILDALVLSGKGNVLQAFCNILIFGGAFAILAYYSWTFHRRTKS